MIKVIEFPKQERQTANEVLEMMKDKKLKSVVVIGMSDENTLHHASNETSASEIMYLIELCKRCVIDNIIE